MARKIVSFNKGIKPKLSLGFNRPASDIIDAPVLEVFKSKRADNAGIAPPLKLLYINAYDAAC